ncbi:hypothetical protein LguiB_000051 [Lonicera macranthoides]
MVQPSHANSDPNYLRSNSKECLILQLSHLDSIPWSLLNFLNLPNFTFAGIGIKESMVKLERDYGIGCKNAVELGALAADLDQQLFSSWLWDK